MTDPDASRRPALPAVVLAFAAVYLIWGSTYLAMRWAAETVPPFWMAGTRFTLAGLLMYLAVRALGQPAPTRAQVRSALLAGVLMVPVGNVAIVWAQTHGMPTGLAALVAALTPLGTVLANWLAFGAARPRTLTFVGLGVGLAGMLVLIGPSLAGVGTVPLVPALVVVVGIAGWCYGSLVARHDADPAPVWVNAALQPLLGGMVALALSPALGERVDVSAITLKAALSWVYLIVFGSWIGFTAFAWLMARVSPTVVSTYALVNPVVAVLIGAAVLGESLNGSSAIGGGVILGSVALILASHRPARRATPADPAVPRVGAATVFLTRGAAKSG